MSWFAANSSSRTKLLQVVGDVELCIDAAVLAVQNIVEEAGGRFTTLSGDARADADSGVSTNGRLQEKVLAAL